MSFKEQNYYQKIVSANVLAYSTLPSDDEKEIYLRNIISRTYYSCYLHCRDALIAAGLIQQTELDDDKSHAKVINELPRGLKMQLKQLKNFRIKADYNNDPLRLPLQGKAGRHSLRFASPEHFQDILKTILSYQCSS